MLGRGLFSFFSSPRSTIDGRGYHGIFHFLLNVIRSTAIVSPAIYGRDQKIPGGLVDGGRGLGQPSDGQGKRLQVTNGAVVLCSKRV